MLSEFLRDHAFSIAWMGLMAMVWCGWGLEDPLPGWRWKLGLGCALGPILTAVFIFTVVQHWESSSSLDGREGLFGLLVAVEIVLALLGVLVLIRARRGRWIAWWVAIVVAAHFVPMAFLLEDLAYAVLGVFQIIVLMLLIPRLRDSEATTSRLVGPVMGSSIIGFVLVSAVLFLVRHGLPWAA